MFPLSCTPWVSRTFTSNFEPKYVMPNRSLKINLLLFFLMLIFLVSVTACDISRQPTTKNTIIGKWQKINDEDTSVDSTATIEFLPNNMFISHQNQIVTDNTKGKYTIIEPNQIKIEIDNTSNSSGVQHHIVTYEFSILSNKMTL